MMEVASEGVLMAGVMQIIASRLAGQRSQEPAGHSEMHEGIRGLDAWRAAANARWNEEWAQEEAIRRATAAKSTAKKKPKA
jgi:hypothetical protein